MTEFQRLVLKGMVIIAYILSAIARIIPTDKAGVMLAHEAAAAAKAYKQEADNGK